MSTKFPNECNPADELSNHCCQWLENSSFGFEYTWTLLVHCWRLCCWINGANMLFDVFERTNWRKEKKETAAFSSRTSWSVGFHRIGFRKQNRFVFFSCFLTYYLLEKNSFTEAPEVNPFEYPTPWTLYEVVKSKFGRFSSFPFSMTLLLNSQQQQF